MLMLKLIILSIAIFQGIAIGFILLNSPFFKSKANQYLAFSIFSLSYSLLKIALEITQAIENFPYPKIVEIIDTELLFSVLILLFVIHQVNHPSKKSHKLRWLFVPPIISTVIAFFLDYVLGINEQTFESANFINLMSIALLIILFINFHLFTLLALFKTYKIIQQSKHRKEKKWLSYLWLLEIIILSSLIIVTILGPFVLSNLSNAMQILALFATFIIHWIAYTGVYKLKLINDQSKLRALLNSRMKLNALKTPVEDFIAITSEPVQEHKKPKKPTEENVYFKELELLCSEQKIYRDKSLDRNKVAEMLGISPSYVSQLTNSITGENFSTYINQYRVEEAKKLILDEELANYSLLAIGLECGFSSKTTYYNWFKKTTGVTPNTFRKKHQ